MNEIEVDMIDQSTTTKMLLDLVGQEVRLNLITGGVEMVQDGKLKRYDGGFAVEYETTSCRGYPAFQESHDERDDEYPTTRSLIFMPEDVVTLGKRNGVAIIVAIR